MNYKIFIYLILSSVAFFNPHGVFENPQQKFIFYLAVLISFIYVYFKGVSLKDVKYPRGAYFVLLAGIFVSMFMATAFHQQSIKVSLLTTMYPLTSWIVFWILLKLDVPRQKILKTYLVLAGVSTVIYFCNVATLPNNIFGKPLLSLDETRGIVRLPVVFIEMFPLLLFFCINQWFETHKKKWIWIAAGIIVMIFLSVLRQYIAVSTALALWFFFRKVSIAKKLAMVATCALVVLYVLPQIPMYKTMVELSEDQRDDNEYEENIRIQAWRHYTYENQTNAITPFFGNGIPAYGQSIWGTMCESENDDSGKFAEDVGWAGFFWYFGAFATVALLLLLIGAAVKRKPVSRTYLTYWFIFIMLICIASAPNLYSQQIVSICVGLYLVYKPDENDVSHDKPEIETGKDDTDVASEDITVKYPQIQ